MCLQHFCLNRAPVLQAQGVFCQCRQLFIWECHYKTPLKTLQLPHFCFYLAWSCYKQAIWIKEKKPLKMGFFLWWLSWNVSREDSLVFFTFSPTNFLLSRFDTSPNPSDFHERFLDSPSNLLLWRQSQTLTIVMDSSAFIWFSPTKIRNWMQFGFGQANIFHPSSFAASSLRIRSSSSLL